jgi:dipeptidase E
VRILLVSNSTQYGRGYLDNVENEIKRRLGAASNVLFVPVALFDRQAYATKAEAQLRATAFAMQPLSPGSPVNPMPESIFVGGGNTSPATEEPPGSRPRHPRRVNGRA